jgi:hypothetical protein
MVPVTMATHTEITELRLLFTRSVQHTLPLCNMFTNKRSASKQSAYRDGYRFVYRAVTPVSVSWQMQADEH